MITTPFTQTDWLSTSNLFFILPLSYIFSSKKIFIVISVMRERVGSIPDTFNLYLASWWSICSCNLHLSLQLLISVFLNCAEIFFHESGYFMTKVSIIQNNLDENNLLFLPLILPSEKQPIPRFMCTSIIHAVIWWKIQNFTLLCRLLIIKLVTGINHHNSMLINPCMVDDEWGYWGSTLYASNLLHLGNPGTMLLKQIYVNHDLLQKRTWHEANKVTHSSCCLVFNTLFFHQLIITFDLWHLPDSLRFIWHCAGANMASSKQGLGLSLPDPFRFTWC